MSSRPRDLDEDEFVFDPNGWDIAVALGIGSDPATDGEALDELADAILLWLEGPHLERLIDEAVERIWSDELKTMFGDGLLRLREREDWRAGVERAAAEFDRDPKRAKVSREVVCHLAMELSHTNVPVMFCADCLEEELSHADAADRRRVALRAAVAARRTIDPSDSSRATRKRLRARLGRLADLGRESVTALASELQLIAAEPVPIRAEDDEVWRALRDSERAGVAHLN